MGHEMKSKKGFLIKPSVPPPACMLPEISAIVLLGLVNKEEGEGIEWDSLAQHEHEWHARPLTSPHWSGS